jgi:hypothetical protein
MTKTEINDTKYKLTNTNNYNNYLICNLKEIVDNYIHILLNYILLFNQKINTNANTNINSNIKFFILKKGISAINHIFLFILYYTKNLEVTFYHSQNSYVFYLEFIEQLNFNSTSDYIKLTLNDAIMFVYKKNIFSINNSISNVTDQEKEIFGQIKELLKIYSEIINIFITDEDFNLIQLKNIINNFQSNISLKIKNKNIMNSIYHFLNMLYILDVSSSQKNNLLFLFINELNSKKNINFSLLKNKIKTFDFIDNINPLDIINLLFD